MAPSLSLRGLMVVICSLAVLSLAQTLDTLYIKPTPDTPCHEVPCFTLMEYVDNSSQYFTRDTEAVFLSGQHLLARNIFISNIKLLTMHKELKASESHPEILCTAAVGLVFTNVSFVNITELSFSYCGFINATASSSPEYTTWVLYTDSVDLFRMANVTVKKSHSYAVHTYKTTFHSLDNCFHDNIAGHGIAGGGILAFVSKVVIDNCQFYNNSGISGSAVFVLNSVTHFRGVNIFAGNKVPLYGGGIFLLSSFVFFEGSNTFMHNSATESGGAFTSVYSVVKFNGSTTFMDNSVNDTNCSVCGMAAILTQEHGNITFTGNTTFIRNAPSTTTLVLNASIAVFEGIFTLKYNQGGIVTIASNVTITGMVRFINNSAGTLSMASVLTVGFGSRLTFNGTMLFAGNSIYPAMDFKFGVVSVAASSIQFLGHTTFTDNMADTGAALVAVQAVVEFNGTQYFEHNAASTQAGVIYMVSSTVNIKGYSIFSYNSAGTHGGAISSINGKLNITGNATFIGNQAPLGGALYLEYTSELFLISPLSLSFKYNSADKGGAIYISDTASTIFCYNDSILKMPIDIKSCFIQIKLPSNEVQLDFDGNTARGGGQNVFGGMLDMCNVNNNLLSPKRGLSLLIDTLKTNISTISSEPLHLCFCLKGLINCTYEPPPFSIVRGATISVSAVALDQVNHTVAAIIQSYFPYNNETVSDFNLGQGVQQIGAMCTDLNYTILTTASNVTIVLYPEGPCRDIGNSQRQISVHLLPCPIAFELSDVQCICEMRLQPFTNSCSSQSQTFTRNTNFWVGAEYRNGNYTGLVIHSHCPLDYCISYPADISVRDLDSQCNFNRCGILCGSCQQNLSLALGSSQCLPCSNYYLTLVIPFAVAGVALVFILFILRLTLSNGTLSGLIFYANIVAVNKEIFFTPRTTNVLTVFIAWLNLDLGLEACFLVGMDTYIRTWLQYVFPFYIWLMVSTIIVTSHYSVRVPKLLGRNPVAVLATLFLLSYAKLLRTIIASFSAAVLEYPDNTTDTVWLYDGNIRYLRGKHIPLFLFSLVVLLFLFLPYTVLLFLSQWLQALSNKKFLFWMNSLRMKTFLDAYHAPYNIKHRYWPGLLLLLRCVLFLVFASNASGNPSVNLLAISSVALGLAVLAYLRGQAYSKWWLDALESSFVLNLGILAAATHHVIQSGGNQSAVAYLSVSVAFIEFAGIIVYHSYLQLKDTKLWNFVHKWAPMLFKHQKTEEEEEPPIDHGEEVIPKPPSTTFIDLREPLLDFPS